MYIGFSIENERCILYQLDKNNYYDLEKKESVYRAYLYDGTLINYDKLMKYDSLCSKRTVLREYKKEKRQFKDNDIIGIFDVYIGDTEQVMNLEMSKGIEKYIVRTENKLFQKYKNKDGYEYVDMINHASYRKVNDGLFMSDDEEFIRESDLMNYNVVTPSVYSLDLTRKQIIDKYKNLFGMNAYLGLDDKCTSKTKIKNKLAKKTK